MPASQRGATKRALNTFAGGRQQDRPWVGLSDRPMPRHAVRAQPDDDWPSNINIIGLWALGNYNVDRDARCELVGPLEPLTTDQEHSTTDQMSGAGARSVGQHLPSAACWYATVRRPRRPHASPTQLLAARNLVPQSPGHGPGSVCPTVHAACISVLRVSPANSSANPCPSRDLTVPQARATAAPADNHKAPDAPAVSQQQQPPCLRPFRSQQPPTVLAHSPVRAGQAAWHSRKRPEWQRQRSFEQRISLH